LFGFISGRQSPLDFAGKASDSQGQGLRRKVATVDRWALLGNSATDFNEFGRKK
jgi:hypothetical protein